MGLNVALQLAAKGANIVIVARNVGKLEEALAAIKVGWLPDPGRQSHQVANPTPYTRP